MNKKEVKNQPVVQNRSSAERTTTPQYEYARKEIASWPEWKREISMSGLVIQYQCTKK